MPKYQFTCDDCSISPKMVKKSLELKGEDSSGYSGETGEFLFIINCRMADKPSHPKCPKCDGKNTRSSYTGYSNECWIRGNGIVTDRRGARRDMNRHTLVNNDPYGHMRQSGEVDHMLDTMRRTGMDMTQIKQKRAESIKRAKERADKIKFSVNEEQRRLLMSIDRLEYATMDDFKDFEDINGLLSSLIPEFVCRTKRGKFVLMAAGKKVIDGLTV